MNKENDAHASGITPENSGKTRELSEERKEKKSKEKKSKENKSAAPEVCTQPAQTRFEIPALIQALAEEKRAFPNGSARGELARYPSTNQQQAPIPYTHRP